MKKAITWTRTFTSVFVVGEELAAKSENLRLMADKMKEAGEKYEDEFKKKGVRLKETDDPDDMKTMKYQWQEIVGKMIINDSEKVSEIVELFKKEFEEEPINEFRMGIK